jgi:hypothetical protein
MRSLCSRVGSSKAGRFYCASIGVSCGGLAWKTLATTAPWLAPHTAGLEDPRHPRHHRPLARPAHSWPGRPSPPPPLGLEDPRLQGWKTSRSRRSSARSSPTPLRLGQGSGLQSQPGCCKGSWVGTPSPNPAAARPRVGTKRDRSPAGPNPAAVKALGSGGCAV